MHGSGARERARRYRIEDKAEADAVLVRVAQLRKGQACQSVGEPVDKIFRCRPSVSDCQTFRMIPDLRRGDIRKSWRKTHHIILVIGSDEERLTVCQIKVKLGGVGIKLRWGSGIEAEAARVNPIANSCVVC